jgi:hypothetical protein
MVGMRIPVRAEPLNGSAVCLQCGMCCDGTLFNIAPLEAGEDAAARALGMTVSEATSDGKRSSAFGLPCHLHQEGRCTIYGQWRPRICHTYSCRLRDAYIEGSRSLEDCLRVVRLVRETAADAAASGGAPPSDQPQADHARDQEGLLARAAFEVLLQKYFKKPPLDPEPQPGT